MAMAVAGQDRHYEWSHILRRHWLSTARACGIAPEVAQAMIDELVANTPAVIAEVAAALPPTFPAQLADAIFAGVGAAAVKLANAN